MIVVLFLLGCPIPSGCGGPSRDWTVALDSGADTGGSCPTICQRRGPVWDVVAVDGCSLHDGTATCTGRAYLMCK